MIERTYNEVHTIFMCFLYITLGLLSAFCCMLNLSVWLLNRELRQKYIYLIALDFCDLINAISFVLVGSGRASALFGNSLWMTTTIRDCFFKKVWPHFLILGTQLPSLMIILISCERFCAVLKPFLYKQLFTGYSKPILLMMVPIAGILSLIVAGLSTIGEAGDEETTSQHCSITTSTAYWYSTFHFIFITSAYVFSFSAIFVVKRVSKRHSKRKFGGDNRFGVMLIVTGSSVILVGAESIAQLLLRWDIIGPNEMIFAITHSMPAFLSICSTSINIIFRPDFRKQFFCLIRRRKMIFSGFHGTSVKPVTTIARPTKSITIY